MSFFSKLKEVFEKIPIKTRFLNDLGFNNSYSGFRYFMQDRKSKPSQKLMEKLCDRMNYDYVTIPVKRDPESQAKLQELEDQYFKDLEDYLKEYENDETRVYVKNYGKESTVASAIEAFSKEETFNEQEKIDVSDLF
jgi:hypothetical protein